MIPSAKLDQSTPFKYTYITYLYENYGGIGLIRKEWGGDMQKKLRGLAGRDLQNIPLDNVNRAVKAISFRGGFNQAERKKLVTMYLNPSTIEYFKKQADKYHTKYQRFMRAVLDQYREFHR